MDCLLDKIDTVVYMYLLPDFLFLAPFRPFFSCLYYVIYIIGWKGVIFLVIFFFSPDNLPEGLLYIIQLGFGAKATY